MSHHILCLVPHLVTTSGLATASGVTESVGDLCWNLLGVNGDVGLLAAF